jgi:tetratricopeptide (TPR) repeat protein
MSKYLDFSNNPVLSLCMIVKNEKHNLPRCLARIKPYVDEVIVVDTGSEDGTPEIAAKYGAKVSYFEWCDDFSAARNYAISQASGNWILMPDADEELIIDSKDFLKQLTSKPDILAYSVALTEANDPSRTPAYLIRFLRNIPEIKYVGRFHEQPIYQNQYIKDHQIGYLEDIRILHYGYGKEQVFQKNLIRNIPLLERARQEDGLSLMLLYCLAGMYTDTQQIEKAQECYTEAFDRLLQNLIDGTVPTEFSFVPSLIFVLGTQSLQQEDYEAVRLLCQRGLEWCPNYPPLSYLAGAAIRALGFPLGAVAYFENCLRLGREGNYYKGEPFELSYMTTYPAYDLGCVYIELERQQEALAAFELALSFDANFTAAQEKADKIRRNLATQAELLRNG